jgi:transposase InsO family protein
MAASADETLVEGALRMALSQRPPPAGVVHHTDRACHDTSQASQALLAEMSLTVSRSRKATWWDNAVSQSVFGTRHG